MCADRHEKRQHGQTDQQTVGSSAQQLSAPSLPDYRGNLDGINQVLVHQYPIKDAGCRQGVVHRFVQLVTTR